MDALTVIAIAVVLAAIAFIAFGNLRPARSAQIPETQKRND
jgi:hypothetical protein